MCAHLHITWLLYDYSSHVYCSPQECCSHETHEISRATILGHALQMSSLNQAVL